MRIPVVKGVIDRRVLVNYRVDQSVMQSMLPRPFRPHLHNGDGIAGICLIRLKSIRPRSFPGIFGMSSENAAHRIAVEWDAPDGVRCGVYIPRRDTSSRLNVIVGGRLFPGVHHRADFNCTETEQHIEIEMHSRDGSAHVHVVGEVAGSLPSQSGFHSLSEASEFFALGSLGYSATSTPSRFDGLELRTEDWRVQPLHITHVASSFFEDAVCFPAGSVTFDCALLMREVPHEWHGREELCCEKATA